MRMVHLGGAIAGGVVIAVAGYSGYWFLAADAIEDRIASWAEEQRAHGWEVDPGQTAVSGFPTRFAVTFKEPHVVAEPEGWSWRGEQLSAEMKPWRTSEIQIVMHGGNEVRLKEKDGWRNLDCLVGDGQAKLFLTKDHRLKDIAFDLTGVTVSGLLAQGPARVGHVRAQSVRHPGSADTANRPSETMSAAVSLQNVDLPSDIAEGLGQHIETLSFDASLLGPVPGEARRDAVMAWSKAGGALELKSLNLRWGPLGLNSAGTLALDDQLRPIGAFTADIVGYGDVIDALILSDLIPIGDAFMAKVAFNVMAEKPTDGGPMVLRQVPLTAQDGGLFVGPVAFAKLPALDLPQ